MHPPPTPRKARPSPQDRQQHEQLFVSRNILSPFNSLHTARPEEGFYYVPDEVIYVGADLMPYQDSYSAVGKNFFFDTRQAAQDGCVSTLYEDCVLAAMIQWDGQIFNPFTRNAWPIQQMPELLRKASPCMARHTT